MWSDRPSEQGFSGFSVGAGLLRFKAVQLVTGHALVRSADFGLSWACLTYL
ncbi:MAG: hypothetical protein QOH35_986 [Acidobacteriaceae bacterium]|nr:hypothetical protein [Acidobacteriaceae bacterium]